MDENRDQKSFWTTRPGILTELTALIIAITGLIVGLQKAGLIGGSQPVPTSVPPAGAPAPNTLPDSDIPLLNAHVVALRFYESGPEGLYPEQRVYGQLFASDSRHINWELNLDHPAPGRRIDFHITAIYHFYNGALWEEIGTQDDYVFTVEEYWVNSSLTRGWGYSFYSPENWNVGTYRVDLYFEDKKIASERFEIYTTPDIPLFDGYVTSLRFYKSDGVIVPSEQRVYAQRFASDTTRYINWELNLDHPAPGRPIDFQITAIYYRDIGGSWNEISRDPFDTYVEATWINSYHTTPGVGYKYPGKWEIGSYRVDLYFEDKIIASEHFEIY
jgi:hypothetical protein